MPLMMTSHPVNMRDWITDLPMNSPAPTLAKISSATSNQEPHTSHQTGRISPFPTPSRKHDSFLTPRAPDECFWSSSGSEQGSPSKHGEASENTGTKAELELSLARLDFHAPTSPVSSLTDDEVLPPYIIMIKKNSESDGERQPPPSCLTQTSTRGSQPTPSPPPRTEDQQGYVKTKEPKREPEITPAYPTHPPPHRRSARVC
jgi:hypothetical protein